MKIGELDMSEKTLWDYLEPNERSCDNCGLGCGGCCVSYGKRPDNGEELCGLSTSETKKLFPNGCSDWRISMTAYCEIEEEKERNLKQGKDITTWKTKKQK